MKKKCPNCRLVNFATATECVRCRENLREVSSFLTPERSVRRESRPSLAAVILRRSAVCVFAVCFTIFGFYLSLIGSAERLHVVQKQEIMRSVDILDRAGFRTEVTLLRHFTAYRATDNWLNASVEKENAYAATNFPFEIMTIYEEFFTVPLDETERAAILLHEAQHLKGADEPEAYAFVWKNKARIGWTKAKYANSVVWRNVRKQTREVAPELFVCEDREFADCTE